MNPDKVANTTLPLITIATVTYNAEATLQRTLDSVMSQDYARIEHLIIDGLSTDKTLSLVQRYVEQNNNRHQIRLSSEPDEGLYDAMNKALVQATGEYIVFLNAGDKLHSQDTISKVVECAGWRKGNNGNPAILYGETDLVDNEGKFIRHRRLKAPKVLTWKKFLSGMRVCHQSFYVRTDLARSESYNLSYRYSADYDWCIRIMKKAAKRRIPIKNTGQILTDYLSEGMTTKNHRKSLMERLRLMARHYGWGPAITAHCWFVIRAVIKR
ncbi:MAG: glycosyltransferase [Bacteroidaceae bacterium]|nr:glycosyltransferase [Bacteroidaceae bacterium]